MRAGASVISKLDWGWVASKRTPGVVGRVLSLQAVRPRALLPCWLLSRETLSSLSYGLLHRAANSMAVRFFRANK